jgi:hypothetical protein
VDAVTQGKRDAPLKLNKVVEKIEEIRATADLSGYTAKHAKWTKVGADIKAAIAANEQGAYTILA